MIGHVYSLACAKTNVVFYIGCTSMNLEERLVRHKSASKKINSRVYNYIRDSNIEIKLDYVERIVFRNKNTLYKAEEFWIEQFRQWGFDLKNDLNDNPQKMKERIPIGGGSVRIDSDVFKEAQDFCKKKGMFLSGFVTSAIKEKLEKSKTK